MFKRSGQDSEKEAGGFWSRFGIQLALIAILSAAALSFFTLGMLNRNKGPELPKKQVQTAVSQLVQAPPPEAETATAPPAAAPPAQPAPPAAQPPTVVAAATEPETTQPRTDSGSTKPVATDQPTAGQTQLKTAAQPAPQASEQPAPTPVATKQLTKQPTFPPPEAKPEPKKEPELVPKPLWQTVDQQWDTVKIDGSAPDNLDAVGAAWKQIDVGQTDQVRENAVPAPVAKAAEKVDTPASKPGQTQVRPKAEPKKTKPKTKVKSRAKKRYKPRTARKKSTRNNRRGVRLTIINESGKRGQAEVYRDVLRAMGYSVIHLEDRPRKPGPTTILYGAGLKSTAQSLSKRIPGKRTLAPLGMKSSRDIVIVVR